MIHGPINIRLGGVKEYSSEGIICKNGFGENYIMRTFSMYTTRQVFLRALIESGCKGRDMWQINALVCAWKMWVQREVFIEINLKGNGRGKWAVITFLVIVTRGGLL